MRVGLKKKKDILKGLTKGWNDALSAQTLNPIVNETI